jgi:NAD(P)-dependent dehydrogenase (short-subunit alcohol dehydrogenase family)
MPTVLITGCDAGLGREFAKQYDAAGWSVIATHQSIENAIEEGAGIRNFALDVTRENHFTELKSAIGTEPIDLLVSNAGIGLDTRCFGQLDFDYVKAMFDVNTLGPLRLVDTFLDNVAKSELAHIAVVTSRMGSIALNLSGGHYGYRSTKAGLNAMMHSIAIDLFAKGITIVNIHPGWVDTAGGGGGGALSAEESVSAMRSIVRKLGSHETGQFLNYDGTPLPW